MLIDFETLYCLNMTKCCHYNIKPHFIRQIRIRLNEYFSLTSTFVIFVEFFDQTKKDSLIDTYDYETLKYKINS